MVSASIWAYMTCAQINAIPLGKWTPILMRRVALPSSQAAAYLRRITLINDGVGTSNYPATGSLGFRFIVVDNGGNRTYFGYAKCIPWRIGDVTYAEADDRGLVLPHLTTGGGVSSVYTDDVVMVSDRFDLIVEVNRMVTMGTGSFIFFLQLEASE